VNFDLDTNDWKGDYVAAKANFLGPVSAGNKATSNFLVLMHDIHQDTVNILVPWVLDQVKTFGYQTVTVGECLGDPAENWYRDPIQGSGVKDTGSDIAKAVDSKSSNTTLPSASVSAGAFGAQSSGHGNATNGTIVQSASPSASKTGGAAVVSAMGLVSMLSMVAFFMSFM
jgi:hypothetical protein